MTDDQLDEEQITMMRNLSRIGSGYDLPNLRILVTWGYVDDDGDGGYTLTDKGRAAAA